MNSIYGNAASVGSGAVRVSEFLRQIRRQLESGFPLGWVQGEVSGLSRAGSGHLYFSLKDSDAQLRCTMWRNRAQLLPFQLREGMQVEVRAQLNVYEARGDLQLSVEHIRPAGQGNLFEAFMRLKSRLEAEGLFASELKQPLPRLPRCIGIISSPDAAALQDVLASLQRRASGLQLVLYPTRVQGEGAAAQIAEAIASANARRAEDGCEALLLCRGGGSLEDLWAFNEEVVVRALRASALPVICGVGHETDTTLADFAADARAATPTAAAELISAGLFALRGQLPLIERQLRDSALRALARRHQQLDLLERRLVHPRQRMAALQAHLEQLGLRLQHATTRALSTARQNTQQLQARWLRSPPNLNTRRQQLDSLHTRLEQALQRQQQVRRHRLQQLATALELLNPSAVLERGYAIVRDAHGHIVRDAALLKRGDTIDIALARGQVGAQVTDSQSGTHAD